MYFSTHFSKAKLSQCFVVLFSLFTYVDESKFSTGTYAAFIDLLDNYRRTIGQPEEVYQSELDENERFLNETLKTEVMILASAYLAGNSKGYIVLLNV